jgi:A/G-specific adenine glycosylase
MKSKPSTLKKKPLKKSPLKMDAGTKTTSVDSAFAQDLVDWQRKFGRHDLPWQKKLHPYRVWVSEIMLQQTQVVTVMGYFERFMARFPDVNSLASANQEEVLGLWSGLGYYSRARNLHKCAQQVVQLHQGVFPSDAQTLETLPGIGPSTAAAIASICFKERVPILDGNVKRVLSRLSGFDGDLSITKSNQELLSIAKACLPQDPDSMPIYTQGIMDLGATICTPKKAQCEVCPVKQLCVAKRNKLVHLLPIKTKRIKRSSHSVWMVLIKNTRNQALLVQRPGKGVWAGLFCLPWFESAEQAQSFLSAIGAESCELKPVIKHSLTHRELFLHPALVNSFSVSSRECLQLAKNLQQAAGHEEYVEPLTHLPASARAQWMTSAEWAQAGLPAPVRKLLEAVFF